MCYVLSSLGVFFFLMRVEIEKHSRFCGREPNTIEYCFSQANVKVLILIGDGPLLLMNRLHFNML